MSVGLVLDTSALLVHVRLERLSAGELIGEVADNGDITGAPALAVLDALPQLKGDDRARLERLVTGEPGQRQTTLEIGSGRRFSATSVPAAELVFFSLRPTAGYRLVARMF